MSGRVKLQPVGSDRWRVSAVCFSGHEASVEGEFWAMTRLALRADRLLRLWGARTSQLPTVPPPREVRMRAWPRTHAA